MKRKILIITAGLIVLFSANSCDDCTFALADLVFNSVESNKQANNGEIVLDLNETIAISSQVINEFAEGDCKDHTESAGSSELKAVLNVLNDAGQVLGTIDTLYGVDQLDPGQIDEVLSQVTFFQEGLYELEFELDAQNKVEERIEDNNWIDVFNTLWSLYEVFFGTTKSNFETFRYNYDTHRFAVKVGDGSPDKSLLVKAQTENDFSAFAKFE